MRKLTSHKSNPLNDALEILVLDTPGVGGMSHVYEIHLEPPGNAGRLLTRISFQNGPIGESGFNGLSNETLLAIVIDRLEGAQAGPFACKDNEDALGLIKGGLTCLHKRTKTRTDQGVEGKSEPHVEPPPTVKKYCWMEEGDDVVRDLSDSVAVAIAKAQKFADEDQRAFKLQVFDCRPAVAADREEFEGLTDDDDIDFEKPDWFSGRWVPENIVHEQSLTPAPKQTDAAVALESPTVPPAA